MSIAWGVTVLFQVAKFIRVDDPFNFTDWLLCNRLDDSSDHELNEQWENNTTNPHCFLNDPNKDFEL